MMAAEGMFDHPALIYFISLSFLVQWYVEFQRILIAKKEEEQSSNYFRFGRWVATGGLSEKPDDRPDQEKGEKKLRNQERKLMKVNDDNDKM